jgi:hypothetical protein
MLYGIKCKDFFTVSADDLRSMGWGEEKWHKNTLPNFDGKMTSLTWEAVRSTAVSCWSGDGVPNEGFYTFSLDGNSCHFDTFLEQMYWIRERVQEPLYVGKAPGRPAFEYMRPLFERMHELHMIVETDASAQVQMNEVRNKLRKAYIEAIIVDSGPIAGLYPEMSDMGNWWYRMGYNGMSSKGMFGSIMKHLSCNKCNYEVEKEVRLQDWQMHRADMLKYNESVGMKLMHNQRGLDGRGSYLATDVLQSLRGAPHRDITRMCPDCVIEPSRLVYTTKHTLGQILMITCELGLTNGSRPNMRFVPSP